MVPVVPCVPPSEAPFLLRQRQRTHAGGAITQQNGAARCTTWLLLWAQVEVLRAHFHCYLVDLPGHGASGPTPEGVTALGFPALLERTVAALGLQGAWGWC